MFQENKALFVSKKENINLMMIKQVMKVVNKFFL